MNRRLISSFALLTLLVVGVACYVIEKKKLPADPAIGSADESGNMVLHVFCPGEKDPCVARLVTDYGVVICRDNQRGALFVLGDRARKTVREFGSYPDFAQALGELPPGSVVAIYDRCTVPRFYDFYPVHVELYKKFSRHCAAKEVKIADLPQITCTCGGGQ